MIVLALLREGEKALLNSEAMLAEFDPEHSNESGTS